MIKAANELRKVVETVRTVMAAKIMKKMITRNMSTTMRPLMAEFSMALKVIRPVSLV